MNGASRAALRAGGDKLREALATGIHGTELGDQLFGATAVIDGSGTLRRALTDPSREGADRAALARRLFGGKVSDQAIDVIATLAAQRWSDSSDLADSLEQLGVRAVLSSAEYGGRIDQVEDELFRFERIVAADPALREALTDRRASGPDKAGLVSKLLDGKASPETIQLARQVVLAPRNRRFDRGISAYLKVASQLRDELTGIVTAAVPLDDEQRRRLGEALATLYGRPGR
mgnify:CR=1 FL=1